MSGLSTIGIISLGLALVAGRKRLPIPATGNTALVTFFTRPTLPLSCAILFVDDRNAELMGLFQLASRFGARDHVVRLTRHRRRDFPAAALDHLLGFLTRQSR